MGIVASIIIIHGTNVFAKKRKVKKSRVPRYERALFQFPLGYGLNIPEFLPIKNDAAVFPTSGNNSANIQKHESPAAGRQGFV